MEQTRTRVTADDPCIVCTDAAIRRGDTTIWSHGTFAIPRGTVTAVVGTNGAGKTTLLNAELGLIPLSHGNMRVLGARRARTTRASVMCRKAIRQTSTRA